MSNDRALSNNDDASVQTIIALNRAIQLKPANEKNLRADRKKRLLAGLKKPSVEFFDLLLQPENWEMFSDVENEDFNKDDLLSEAIKLIDAKEMKVRILGASVRLQMLLKETFLGKLFAKEGRIERLKRAMGGEDILKTVKQQIGFDRLNLGSQIFSRETVTAFCKDRDLQNTLHPDLRSVMAQTYVSYAQQHSMQKEYGLVLENYALAAQIFNIEYRYKSIFESIIDQLALLMPRASGLRKGDYRDLKRAEPQQSAEEKAAEQTKLAEKTAALLAAKAHEEKYEFLAAMAQYQKASLLDPDDREISSLYGRAYAGHLVENFLRRGEADFAAKRYDDAIAQCNGALLFMPNYTEAFKLRAKAYCRLGLWNEAIEDFQKLVHLPYFANELSSSFAEAYFGKGKRLADVGAYEEARAAYEVSIEFKRDDFKTYYHLGHVNSKLWHTLTAVINFYTARGYSDANSRCEDCLRILLVAPNAVKSLKDLFIFLLQPASSSIFDVTPNLWRDYSSVIIEGIRKHLDDVQLRRQILLQAKGQDKTTFFAKFFALHPKEFEELCVAEAEACVAQANRQDKKMEPHAVRKEYFDMAIQLNPQCAPAYHFRAVLLGEMKDESAVVKDLDDLIRIESANPVHYVNRAQARYRQKDYKKAIADAEKAIELGFKHPGIHATVALFYQLDAQPEKAIDYYSKEIKETDHNKQTNREKRKTLLLECLKKPSADLFKRLSQADSGEMFDDVVDAKLGNVADAKVDVDVVGLLNQIKDLQDQELRRTVLVAARDPKTFFGKCFAQHQDKLKPVLQAESRLYTTAGYDDYQQKRIFPSLEKFDFAIQLDPENPIPYCNKALVYHNRRGDMFLLSRERRIDELFERAIGLQPPSSQPYHMRGLFYLDQSKMDLAIVDLTKAIALNEAKDTPDRYKLKPADFVDAYAKRCEAYIAKKQYHFALCDYNKATQLGFDKKQLAGLSKKIFFGALSEPSEPFLRLLLQPVNWMWNEHVNDASLDMINEIFKTIIQLKDLKLKQEILCQLLLKETFLGKLFLNYRSKISLKRIVKALEDLVGVSANGIKVLELSEDTRVALAADGELRSALQANFPEMYRILFAPSLSPALLDKAITKLSEKVEGKDVKGNLKADDYNARALAYLDVGKYDLALKDLQSAFALDPKSALTFFNLGRLHHKQNDLVPAINNYESAMLLDPSFADAHYHRGLACAQIGNMASAVIHFRDAKKLRPSLVGEIAAYLEGLIVCDKSNFHMLRGECWEEEKRFDLAVRDYSEAIASHPAEEKIARESRKRALLAGIERPTQAFFTLLLLPDSWKMFSDIEGADFDKDKLYEIISGLDNEELKQNLLHQMLLKETFLGRLFYKSGMLGRLLEPSLERGNLQKAVKDLVKTADLKVELSTETVEAFCRDAKLHQQLNSRILERVARVCLQKGNASIQTKNYHFAFEKYAEACQLDSALTGAVRHSLRSVFAKPSKEFLHLLLVPRFWKTLDKVNARELIDRNHLLLCIKSLDDLSLKQEMLRQSLIPGSLLGRIFVDKQKEIEDLFIGEMEKCVLSYEQLDTMFCSNENFREKFREKNSTLYVALINLPQSESVVETNETNQVETQAESTSDAASAASAPPQSAVVVEQEGAQTSTQSEPASDYRCPDFYGAPRGEVVASAPPHSETQLDPQAYRNAVAVTFFAAPEEPQEGESDAPQNREKAEHEEEILQPGADGSRAAAAAAPQQSHPRPALQRKLAMVSHS